MADREQTRRDADTIRVILRDAEYFDTEDGGDQYNEAIAALDRILAELEQADGTIAMLTSTIKRLEATVEGERKNREQAERERDGTRLALEIMTQTAGSETARLEQAEARLAKVPALVEALRHYGDEDHWTEITIPESHNTAGYLSFEYDGGEDLPWSVARAALTVYEQSQGNTG